MNRPTTDGHGQVRMAPLGTRIWRGLRLRCPACGGGPILQSWFKLKARCPTCGLRTERGEEDFFLGAMMLNIGISEGLLALLLVGLMIVTWPDVPWSFIQYGGLALMALTPFLFYPVSKTVWMAFDLLLRPLTREELEWHRSAAEHEFRAEKDR